jgi:hypothetical protein
MTLNPRQFNNQLPYRSVPAWLRDNAAPLDPDTGRNILADLWIEKTRDPNYIPDLNDHGHSYQNDHGQSS